MVDISAALEAVHHACLAQDFDAAAALLYRYVFHGPDATIVRRLGSYEAALEALQDFYPSRDTSLEPRVSDAMAKRWVLHETAACLHLLGRLAEAANVGTRAVSAALAANEEHAAGISLHNLAETYLAAGLMGACEDAGRQALALARHVGEPEDELVSYSLLGAVLDLRDRLDEAAAMYSRALRIAVDNTPFPILYSLSGVRYAYHLNLRGVREAALRTASDNADFCRTQRWISDLALATSQVAVWQEGPLSERLERSREAVRTARTSGNHQTLSNVLIEYAGLLLEAGSVEDSRYTLDEARDLALAAGYRVLAVRARLSLARVWLINRDLDSADAEISLVEQLCGALGLEREKLDASSLRQQLDSLP